jgi:ribosomal protein L7/L12
MPRPRRRTTRDECDTFTSVTDISPDLYARLAALESQVAYLFQQMNLAPPGGAPARAGGGPPQEIVDLVRAGNKIQAIKRHRELYGSSLADAKHAIDSLG